MTLDFLQACGVQHFTELYCSYSFTFNFSATFMSYVMLSEKHSMCTKYYFSLTSPCMALMLHDSRNAQWTSQSKYEGSFWELTVQLLTWITSENEEDGKRKFSSSLSAYDQWFLPVIHVQWISIYSIAEVVWLIRESWPLETTV